jgi:hypothetical protein
VRSPSDEPPRASWWQLALLGAVRGAQGLVHPLQRMWRSDKPLETYALCHFSSVAGDTLLGISLADSVFFSLPVDEAKIQIVSYLGLTMLPLALAGFPLVPLLDRAGPRRAISFAAAAGRAVLALALAPRVDDVALFPLALMILVLSKVHAITKNGLTIAYADPEHGLMRSNARLGRIAVAGALAAAPIGFVFLGLWSAAGPLNLAFLVYGVSALLNLRLPHPRTAGRPARLVGPRGRLHVLTGSAIGAIGMRASGGFLLFLLAFALRTEEAPDHWFAVIAVAAVIGGFVADLVAPRLPSSAREEAIVVACVLGAGVGALLAFQLFGLPLLAVFALVIGAGTEFARLAFQGLMQRHVPEGAFGRVFVRYEVLFQLGWIGGAFVPVILDIDFRVGILILAGFYLGLSALFAWRSRSGRDAGDRTPPTA